MPPLDVYALHFKGAVRVGRRGLELEDTLPTIPSDTLFSALTAALATCGEDTAAFLRPFLSDPPQPPFLLTSTFPFAGGVRFYPAPLDWSDAISQAKLQQYGKHIKKVQFISEALFFRLLKGENLDGLLFPPNDDQMPENGAVLQGGQLWLTVAEVELLPSALRLPRDKWIALPRQKVWQRARQPHVTVDRIRYAPDIYHTVQMHFQQGCGLWFGVQWRVAEQHAARALLQRAVDELQFNGLGGKRSIGFGGFTLEAKSPQKVDLPQHAEGGPAYLLSRYHPRAAELPAALQAGRYQLVSVGGWCDPQGKANLLRQRVLMIAEGSRLNLPAGPAGEVCEVSPRSAGDLPHPIYRYGLACAAALNPQGGSHA